MKYNAKLSDRSRADDKREVLNTYKVDKGCADCGYNAHPWALEFDHLPDAIKIKTVASMMYNSWEVIWDEVAKCEVVCSNCHSIRTMTRKQLDTPTKKVC